MNKNKRHDRHTLHMINKNEKVFFQVKNKKVFFQVKNNPFLLIRRLENTNLGCIIDLAPLSLSLSWFCSNNEFSLHYTTSFKQSTTTSQNYFIFHFKFFLSNFFEHFALLRINSICFTSIYLCCFIFDH